MFVTLHQIQNIDNFKGRSLLQIKNELMRLKKKGVLFYSADICSLREEEQFQISYFLLPSEHSRSEAFPIPLSEFIPFSKNEYDYFHYLKPFYESYYPNNDWNESVFCTYDYRKPFIGSEYVWCYQKA